MRRGLLPSRLPLLLVAVGALFLSVLAAVLTAQPEKASAADADRWILVETRVNPYDQPTEFIVGVTPNYYESPRFDGTFTRYTVTAGSIGSHHRSVERGFEYWNMVTNVSLVGPPVSMTPGETITLRANGTASGSIAEFQNPVERFQFFADRVNLVGDTFVVVGLAPEVPSTGAAAPTFEVPSPFGPSDEIRVRAGFWNCASCLVEWVYWPESETGDLPTCPVTDPRGLGLPIAQDQCVPPELRRGPKPRVKYAMPDRYGRPDADGVIRPTANPDPDRFKVVITVKRSDGSPCRPGDVAYAEVPAAVSVRRKPVPNAWNKCKFLAKFEEEGRFRGTFTLESEGKIGRRRSWITVQDWLIVGIGDSNGSGEGTPDIPGPRNPVWVDRRCDRSGNSYQALTAAHLEKQSRKTSVTFVHVACSGAEIETGLLSGYEGINPETPDLLPQMDEVAQIVRDRGEIDALLVSIGVNDLKFGPMVAHCIDKAFCYLRSDVEGGAGDTLAEGMELRLAELPGRYARLASAITAAEIPADRVYISQYFDSTRDSWGSTCNPLISVGVGGLALHFDRLEASWAYEDVLVPLNRAVAAAATTHGWNLISGAEQRFAEHGYCSSDSWIVSLTSSFSNQGDQQGTLHATRKGNEEQRDLVLPTVTADFYPNRMIREPST